MSSFEQTVCPDFPENRACKATNIKERWYKHDGNIMFIPPRNVLLMNMQEIDRCMEAINAFAIMDLEETDATSWKIPYEIITWKQLNAICDSIAKQKDYDKVIACDIECANVKWYDNPLIVIGHYFTDHEKCYMVDTFDDLEEMSKFYSRTDFKFLWHNGKFDVGRIAWNTNKKVVPRIDEDTMLLHYGCINERKGTHSLKDLAPLYLHAPHWEDELDNFKAKIARQNKTKIKDFQYTMIPRDILDPYLAMDTFATRKLLDVFKDLQRDGSERTYQNLLRAANCIWKIEYLGMMADQNHLNEMHIELQDTIDDALDELEEAAAEVWNPAQYMRETGAKTAPELFNVKSSKQLKWLLTQLTGEYIESADVTALNDLAETHGDLTFIDALKRFRKATKMLDTYVISLRNATCPDGRIRATFNIHGTETGRLSSSGPNMQNIPRDSHTRNIFVAREGCKLVQLDYSQAELRMLAWLTQDEWLKQVFRDGRDLHTEVCLAMFGENYSKNDRHKAKTLNFGIAYGRGAASLRDSFKIPMSEALQLVEDWFARMPDVKKWVDERRSMPEAGIEYSTPLGRQRHYIITNKNRHNIQNESINFPVSSLASDMTLISVCDIFDWIKENGLEGKVDIVNTVHDSIILEVVDEPELLEKVCRACEKIMTEQPAKQLGEMDIPFKADAEVGDKWGELE